MVREEENERVKKAAGAAAESRLMDLLLPGSMGSEQHASTREKIRQQLEDQGLGDEARVFARREAALSWLVNNSRVSYK